MASLEVGSKTSRWSSGQVKASTASSSRPSSGREIFLLTGEELADDAWLPLSFGLMGEAAMTAAARLFLLPLILTLFNMSVSCGMVANYFFLFF